MGALLRLRRRQYRAAGERMNWPACCALAGGPLSCRVHRREAMDEEKRNANRRMKGVQRSLESAANSRAMDYDIKANLIDLLSSDADIPPLVRYFLADAMAGSCEHWKLEWKSARRAPRRTAKTIARENRVIKAGFIAFHAIEDGSKTEPAIAGAMAATGVVTSAAYAGLKAVRNLMPDLRRLIAEMAEENHATPEVSKKLQEPD